MLSLLDNNTYMRYDMFNTSHKDSIGWLKYVNPIISLQRITREKMSDALMQVYLNDNEMVAMTNKPSGDAEESLKKRTPHPGI